MSSADDDDGGAALVRGADRALERMRLLLRSPTVIVGAIVIAFWVFCALFPARRAVRPDLRQPVPAQPQPEWGHPFGTDTNGRDVFSRVLAGSRNILLIAPAATLLGTVLGTILGLFTGYLRGVVDDVASRFIDAVLSLPLIVTSILIVTAIGKSGTWVVILVIGLIFAPVVSRTVRAAVLGEASSTTCRRRGCGESEAPYIMYPEILPNVMSPIVVEFTVRLGYAIFTVASLTFIGFGVRRPRRTGRRRSTSTTRSSTPTGGRPLPRARDREPRGRRQPRRRRHPRGVRAMSETAAPRSRTLALAVADLELPTRVRGIDRPVLRGVSF